MQAKIGVVVEKTKTNIIASKEDTHIELVMQLAKKYATYRLRYIQSGIFDADDCCQTVSLNYLSWLNKGNTFNGSIYAFRSMIATAVKNYSNDKYKFITKNRELLHKETLSVYSNAHKIILHNHNKENVGYTTDEDIAGKDNMLSTIINKEEVSLKIKDIDDTLKHILLDYLKEYIISEKYDIANMLLDLYLKLPANAYIPARAKLKNCEKNMLEDNIAEETKKIMRKYTSIYGILESDKISWRTYFILNLKHDSRELKYITGLTRSRLYQVSRELKTLLKAA